MTFIIALIVAPFVLLTFCFALEIFVGLKPLAPLAIENVGGRNATIVVPAHDEEQVLAASLERLNSSAAGQAHILLVADNCSDRTAQIGRDYGVEVIERSEPQRRGKGYALDFAKSHLRSNPPDIVLIVDADCSIDRESVSLLIHSCAQTKRPCQATNLQQPNLTSSPLVQLSTFAFFIKNVIRQRALSRLAARAHLLGTGMAFPWSLFAGAELATGNIVEDLKLGQELAEAGQAPLLVEKAAVWSRAETGENTIAQRRRWEGGFLQNLKQAGPYALGKAVRRADIRLLWAAIDLLIPPFALLLLLDFAVLMIGTLFGILNLTHPWPMFVMLGSMALALVALACAWAIGGHRFVSVASLARVPLYILWKLPMYVGFARRGAPSEWLRTGR